MAKKIVILVTAILGLLAAVPLVLPADYQIERSVIIEARREQVFNYLVDLSSQKLWGPLQQAEPTANFEFHGTPGVVGSRSTWDGKKIGQGEETLVKVVQPEYVETRLIFHQTAAAIGYWKLEPKDGDTLVIWGIKGQLSYPFGRYAGLIFDSLIGTQYESGLASLKNLIESKN